MGSGNHNEVTAEYLVTQLERMAVGGYAAFEQRVAGVDLAVAAAPVRLVGELRCLGSLDALADAVLAAETQPQVAHRRCGQVLVVDEVSVAGQRAGCERH